MLKTQTTKTTKNVHHINDKSEIIGTIGLETTSARVAFATPNKNSSATTATAITAITMLLTKTLGRIQGLPTQITELRTIFRTRISLCQIKYLSNQQHKKT
jgi:hypothetical protein